MKKIIAFLLCIITAFSLVSCKKSEEKNPAPTDEKTVTYEEIGRGDNQFFLDILFEAKEKNYSIKTDEETVGAALEKLGMIEGEQGDYGLYIFAVEGEEHRYENGGKYWAFYENEQYASQSVDLTEIVDGETYSLKVE